MNDPHRKALLEKRLELRARHHVRKGAAVGEDVEGERSFFWTSTSFMIFGGLAGLYLVTHY